MEKKRVRGWHWQQAKQSKSKKVSTGGGGALLSCVHSMSISLGQTHMHTKQNKTWGTWALSLSLSLSPSLSLSHCVIHSYHHHTTNKTYNNICIERPSPLFLSLFLLFPLFPIPPPQFLVQP